MRTDRHIDFFGGERGDDNIEALKRLLGTCVIYDPKLGTNLATTSMIVTLIHLLLA